MSELLQIVSETEVLDNAMSVQGNRVNEDDILIKTIYGDESVNGVVLFGEPGSSKTTILSQIIKRGRTRYGLSVLPYCVGLDEITRNLVQAGSIAPHRSLRTPEQFKLFSDYMWEALEGLLETLPGRTRLPRDILPISKVFLETVSVGQKDQGVSTLVRLGKRPEQDVLFFGVVKHPMLEKRASEFREAVANVSSINELSDVLGRFHLVVDLSDPYQIKEIVGRMGQPDVIEIIANERATLSRKWRERKVIDPSVYSLPTVDINMLDEDEQDEYLERIAFMEHWGLNVLKLPPKRYKTLLIHFFHDQDIHMYQSLLRSYIAA